MNVQQIIESKQNNIKFHHDSFDVKTFRLNRVRHECDDIRCASLKLTRRHGQL